MKRFVLTGIFMMMLGQAMQGDEIGFVEDFSLSSDRPAALKQLIPGTDDYYYWNCLHLLNTEQYGAIDDLLKPWLERHGETARLREIRTRRALLTYDQQPEKSLEYLRNRFGIHFPHQREELNADPNLPTSLDPARISREAFRQRALSIHQSRLQGFEDSAFQWLINNDLNADQRRELLGRLSRPDYPGLVGMVADDLASPRSGGFGSLGIHQQMLQSQLDELLKRNPGLLNQQQFVRTYLRKLQPGPDVNWRHDPQLTADYLDRLTAFADRLAPVHNSLKAHILYHRLVLDRSQGTYDKQRFL
ncbi:MAG: hypothetical protein KDA90_22445, partial [Planctomycetaceae bacterium]|nr:hypothetical protein [Planctomycetaceae bacterium]